MRAISIINQKGGSGKTTTAVNLAAALGERNFKVLLIDMDSQSSATKWLRVTEKKKDFYEFFSSSNNVSLPIIETVADNVDMVPSSQWLAVSEKELSQKAQAEFTLKRKLSTEHLASNYDFILADCPPSLSLLTINALAAFEELLIPVEAQVLSLYGLADLLKNLTLIKKRVNPGLDISGILACRVDKRTKHSTDVIEKLKECFKGLVYRTKIRENVKLAEAPSFGYPITLYDTTSKGAKDYRALAKEVISIDKRSMFYAEEKGAKNNRRKPSRRDSFVEESL